MSNMPGHIGEKVHGTFVKLVAVSTHYQKKYIYRINEISTPECVAQPQVVGFAWQPHHSS